MSDRYSNPNETFVLWIGPGHRIPSCVGVQTKWLKSYRARVVNEWKGVILAVYRRKSGQQPSSS